MTNKIILISVLLLTTMFLIGELVFSQQLMEKISREDMLIEEILNSINEKEKELINEIQIDINNNDLQSAEEKYKTLIEKFPENNNFIAYGLFLAKQKRYEDADKIWRMCIKNITKDYIIIESFYLDNRMYKELLQLYLDTYNNQSISSLQLTKSILLMYDVLNLKEEKATFIATMIKSGSYSIFVSHLDYIIQDAQKEDIDISIILEKLNELLTDETLSTERKIELQRKLAQIYYYKEDYDKSFSLHREVALLYKKQYEEATFDRFTVEVTFKNLITIFENAKEYEKVLIIINDYIPIINKNDTIAYLNVKMKSAEMKYKLGLIEQALLSYLELEKFIDESYNLDERAIEPKQVINSTRFEIYYKIASIYYEKRSFVEAIKYLTKIESHNKNYDPYFLLGKCYLALSEYSLAKENFTQSYEKVMRFRGINSLYYLSIIALFDNQIIKALNFLENVILQAEKQDAFYSTEALIRYNILLSVISNMEKLNEFINYEKLLLSFQYEIILSDNSYVYLEKLDINKDENLYYHFNYVNLLLLEKKFDEAILILEKDISINIIKHYANGFYYQKSIFTLSELYLNTNYKTDNVKEMLLKLIIEYPNTVYLNEIKKLLERIPK